MRIGIDLGGSKIEGVVMDADAAILVRRRIATPPAYAPSLEALAGLVRDLEADVGRTGLPVGVGMPGSISPVSGLVRNANSTWLNGKPFGADLKARLGRPARLANDADCFALSEAKDGAGAGKDVVFGVILGTGCGGGLVVHQRLVSGPSRIAGEWGHTPLPWPRPDERAPPACWCGRTGCLETWISGPGFARAAAGLLGEVVSPEAIVARTRAGDAQAGQAYGQFVDRLARGLAVVCDILDPDVIVLGGGLSRIDELVADVAAAMGPYVFSDVWLGAIARGRHGDSSGVRGAAWLWAPGEA